MKLIFWKHKGTKKELEVVEKRASKVHQENIKKIMQTKQSADKLKQAIKENGITIQMTKSMVRHN